VLYSVYGLARPVFAPMKIGTGTDIAIGISNGMLGGLTGLGGVISTISCQWRGWPKDVQRAVFQPVLFVAFVVISVSQAVAGTFTRDTLTLYGAQRRTIRYDSRALDLPPLLQRLVGEVMRLRGRF